MEKSKDELLAGISKLSGLDPFPDEIFYQIFEIEDNVERTQYVEALRKEAGKLKRRPEFNNLYRAFVYAVSDGAWGVQLVFDNKVILGTRARKTRTRSFNAFSSIDYPETAVFRDTRLVTFLRRPTDQPPVRFYERLEPAVFVLRLVPGMRADIIPLLAPHYRALVLESFGVGGLPGGEHGEMFAALRRWCESGRLAVFTTQVPHEGCDLAVYEVGRAVGELPGVLEARDMTPEAVAVKLMWALGQTTDRAEAEKLFLTPVQWDIL